MRRAFGLIAALTLAGLGGCVLMTDAYYGRYEVACSDIGPAGGWAGAADVPERVAQRLGRKLEEIRSDFPDTVRNTAIGSPPDPSILFQFHADYRISILVTAKDTSEDAATRAANQAITETLTASPCHTWQFRRQHYQKLFADRVADAAPSGDS